jgi:alkylated DNA repair dioxygenase AlkB
MRAKQIELFEREIEPSQSELPKGFRYRPELISSEEERQLLETFERLQFDPFEFHGFVGKRRVTSFGWRYDFNQGGLKRAEDIPAFLLPVREKAAAFAGLQPVELQQALLTEYRPGAAIGWHRDRPVFGEVVGISLLSACNFRFRRRIENGWERTSLIVQPRSVYLLQGPSRTQWEHSIPGVAELRYSITFRKFAV